MSIKEWIEDMDEKIDKTMPIDENKKKDKTVKAILPWAAIGGLAI